MRKWSCGLLVAALFCLGVAAAPVGAVETKKTASSGQRVSLDPQKASSMTPQSVGVRIAQMISKPKAQRANVPSKMAAKTAGPKVIPVPPPVKGRRTTPVPPPKTGEPQIRSEIQKILDLDKKIKSLQGNKSAQLQRIQEQARIHQKILGELETSKSQAAVEKPLDKEALLAQEKLRIIREETQRNAETVDELQAKSSVGNFQGTAKAKIPAA